MSKDATTRIDDTLQFIRTCNIGTYGERASAFALANAFIQNAYPPANAATAGYRTFSDGMSMNGVRQAGNDQQRHMRRAIHLLWHAMGANGNAARAQTLGAGLLAAELLATFRKARIVLDAGANRDHGARTVLTTVIPANPLGFLQENKIMIWGSTANNPDGMHQNVVQFYFTFDPHQDRFELRPTGGHPAPAGAYVFDAASVPAQHWTTPPGRGTVWNPGAPGSTFGNIAGTRLGGSDVMLTTQFTGCSFCMKNVGGVIYAAHISPSVPGVPNPFPSPATMAGQLAGLSPNVGAGDFANHPGAAAFQIYGMGYGNIPGFPNGYPIRGAGAVPLNTMCLLGCRVGGHWSVYSQHTNTAGQIMGAYQIL